MIGKLRSVVVDCKDPGQLAVFYQGVARRHPAQGRRHLVGADRADGAAARVSTRPGVRAAEFPDPRGSQQFHLDIWVDDVDSAERDVLALGATRVTDAVEDGTFRVYRDPAGHTFCLVWGT